MTVEEFREVRFDVFKEACKLMDEGHSFLAYLKIMVFAKACLSIEDKFPEEKKEYAEKLG